MSRPVPRPRVLVVDDDASVLRSVLKSLVHIGAEVIFARSGPLALALLKSMQPLPDLIITDLEMPGFRGEELLSHVRSQEALASIPVVAMTGSGTDRSFDMVLHKPICEADLRNALCLAWPAEPPDWRSASAPPEC